MFEEIQDIPQTKRIPQYMSQEVQIQRAFISALVGAVKDVVGNINVNLQIPEDKREVSLKSDNLEALRPKDIVIPDQVRVSNLDGLAKLLQGIEKKLTDLNAKESPKVEIPEYPTEIKVANFPETKPTDLSAISALLEDIKLALSAKNGVEAVKVENLADINIPQVDYDLIANIVASMTPEAASMDGVEALLKSMEEALRLAPAASHPSFVDPDGEPNRAKMDTNRVLRTSSDGYKKRMTYTATSKIEYVGMAIVGSATSDATWQIQKLTYDASDRLIAVDFANDSDKFQYVWDNRASYF